MADEQTELVSTDDAILNSIGEGDEQVSTDSTTKETTGTDADTTTETSTAGSKQGATGGTDEVTPGGARGPQDLIGKDGNVLAAGGKERRFYETAHREKLRADEATTKVETLQDQLEAINNAGNVSTQYNLTPEEVTTGAQIIAAYKEDPVGTLKYMLTQAQANGHNVDDILNGSTNVSAIGQMIKDAIAPLTLEHQQRVDTQAAEETATTIYNTFITQHPDAVTHENALARLLQQDATLTVDAAYYKLHNYYLQNSLDWTKPLEVLQQEKATAGIAATTKDTLPQPPEGGSVNPTNTTDTAQVADVNTSTADIVRQAMADAGITT
jgi:hypothetical protein